ncbi:hypothetical protein C8P63_10268 [Melghirimyces profundicolus]|uniref:Cytochrome C biogenesis DsbD-like protein n=1 Tax=Melghirimyces profundicolus TaxID=1242148 RepID=A0A2T6C8D5_9BACL|nr:urease accessory protein UreH [Melghirimyces profundicolus]PTX64575.1 hypothetical protein C8P63_10268 [Melghirimyces profundicolus]
MSFEVLSVLGVGLLLGFRHSFDPDHFIAVSTIATRTGNALKSAVSGIFWGSGHTLMLLMIGMPLVMMKTAVPPRLELIMECTVGVMLIVLGWTSIRTFRKQTEDKRGGSFEKPAQQLNLQSFFVGMVHGMAGSGALVLLTMSTLKDWTEAVLYILVFGCGTVGGMAFFALVIGLPFTFAGRFDRLRRTLGIGAGVASLLFGIFYIQDILLS